MPSKPAAAGKSAQLKNKNQGVRGPPRYATNPMGTIKTHRQNTQDALSAVMSQLHAKIPEKKFLPETAPGDGAQPCPEDGAKPSTKPLTPPCEQVSDKSDDSHGLDKEVSHSFMGSKQLDVADSITKRRSQMGLMDTDSASDSSLKKLWDNGGDIASQILCRTRG